MLITRSRMRREYTNLAWEGRAMSDFEPPAPRVGAWYRDAAGELFEVVALDEDDGTVEVQHYDGTIEEYDLDAWFDSQIAVAAPPEDYSGSLDIEREDYGLELDEARNEGGDYLGYVDRAR
jgi:hypothetical protein